MKTVLLNTKPMIKNYIESNSKIRKLCFYLVRHKAFDVIIFCCIIINTIVLTLKWYQMPAAVD